MALARTNPDRYAHVMDEFAAEEREIEARNNRYHLRASVRTASRRSVLDAVSRVNHPDAIDLSRLDRETTDALAKAALWFASDEHDARSVETQIGPRAFHPTESQALSRIRRSVFLESVTEALRAQRDRDEIDAYETEAAF